MGRNIAKKDHHTSLVTVERQPCSMWRITLFFCRGHRFATKALPGWSHKNGCKHGLRGTVVVKLWFGF